MTPALAADEVQAWILPLNRPDLAPEQIGSVLSTDELQRAEKFLRADDRNRYVVVRGVLRRLLGKYLDCSPQMLEFEANAFGKPQLANRLASPIRFNVSHAHDVGLIGVSWNREIGVDVEYRRPSLVRQQIVERFFSPAEIAQLRSLLPEQQSEAFFACWTRKEAYVKALGRGLGISFDQFDVSLRPGEAACLLADRLDPSQVGRWEFHSLDHVPGYTVALAVEGRGTRLVCREFASIE